MGIESCNRDKLYRSLEGFVNRTAWGEKQVTIPSLGEFIEKNLKLIVAQTETGDGKLKRILLQLSDRILVESDQPEAHRLAFEVQGIALGLLAEGARAPWEMLTAELQVQILSRLTPKRTLGSLEIKSQLASAAFTSTSLHGVARDAKKHWVNEEAVSLRTYGCKTAKEAVDYAIALNLQSVNLLEFPDVTNEDIDKLFKNCPKLNILLIKSDKISKLPPEAAQLQQLFCSDCPNLNSLPEGMDKLQQLFCSGCPINSLPEGMDKLQQLDCSGCPNLNNLPEGMDKLQQLFCYDCPINSLPAGMDKLQQLFCSRCPINSLPAGMDKLQQLFCSDCPNLNSLPEGMDKLQKLDCSGCPNLNSLPEKMDKLQELFCSFCPINSLPAGMDKLQKLYCSGCPINSLPVGMDKLQKLDCSGCPINSLPEGMDKLQQLFCYDCPINSLPAGMVKLQQLFCSRCPNLNSLPAGMVKLQELLCRGCPLSQNMNLPVPQTCFILR